MPAYVIAFVDVHDQSRFEKEYLVPIGPTFGPFGGKVIAAADDAETLEGAVPRGRTVIIEFPSLEHARKWYASDAYSPLIAIREAVATSSIVVLPGRA